MDRDYEYYDDLNHALKDYTLEDLIFSDWVGGDYDDMFGPVWAEEKEPFTKWAIENLPKYEALKGKAYRDWAYKQVPNPKEILVDDKSNWKEISTDYRDWNYDDDGAYDETYFLDMKKRKIYLVKFYFDVDGSKEACDWSEANLGLMCDGLRHDKFNYDPANPQGHVYWIAFDKQKNEVPIFDAPYTHMKITESDKTFKMAETFEAPYGGAGSLMDIGKETPLADFTGKELAESSAIHGDFDQASLNYSGHQNLEVRAESEEELYDCVSCGEWGCVSLTLGHCLDCGQQYDAEFEDLTGNITEVKNIMDESVARITISDTKYEDDENIVTDDVDILVTDMDGNTLIDQTLDDSWQPPYDDYDRHLEAESKMGATIKTVGMVGGALALGGWLATLLTPYAKEVFNSDTATATQDMLENDPELVENPNTGDLDPAQYEELVVESTGYAVDVIPMGLDGSFMGSRFAALPTERYVEYNEPGIGAHTDIALNRDEVYLEPEMAMVQAAEEGTVVKEAQAPGQSPYMSIDGQEPKDFDFRVIKETQVVSLDPAVKPFIPQSMSGYTGNANTPPSVYNKMFNVGVLGQTPLFVAGQGDIGSSHTGSRNALPDSLGIAGSVGGPLSDKVNASYTDGTTSMSLAQWAIENTVSQTSDTEAVVIDRSSGAMKRVRRV